MELSNQLLAPEHRGNRQLNLQAGITSSADIPEADWEKIVDRYSELTAEIVEMEEILRQQLEEAPNSTAVMRLEDWLQDRYDTLQALYEPLQNPHYAPGSATVDDVQPGAPLLTASYYGGEPNARVFSTITTLTVQSPITYEREANQVNFTAIPGTWVTRYSEDVNQSPDYYTSTHYPTDIAIMPSPNGYWNPWHVTIVDTTENRIALLDWLRERHDDSHAQESAAILEELIFSESA